MERRFFLRACQSSLSRGKRRIWGGRADVRRAFGLAAFTASRADRMKKALRARLKAAGKPVKITLTACVRKLLTIPNALEKRGQDYVNSRDEKPLFRLLRDYDTFAISFEWVE